MKVQTHIWSSMLAGGALWYLTGSEMSMVGALVGGLGIDADQLIDQLWSIKSNAPLAKPKRRPCASGLSRETGLFERFVRRRKLVRLPLVFHAYELLVILAAVSWFVRTPFLIGLFAGYSLHLLLDFIRHQHEFRSKLFYLTSYRLMHRFRRDRLIRSDYL